MLSLHWQKFGMIMLTKKTVISWSSIAFLTCLGHLRQRNTVRIISICCHPPKVARASTVVMIKWLSCVAVADSFANKFRQCKWSITLTKMQGSLSNCRDRLLMGVWQVRACVAGKGMRGRLGHVWQTCLSMLTRAVQSFTAVQNGKCLFRFSFQILFYGCL